MGIMDQLQQNRNNTPPLSQQHLQPRNNQNGLNEAVNYIKANGGDLRTCCFKKGHEMGLTDEQINNMISVQSQNITRMIQAAQNPKQAVNQAILARNPQLQQMQRLAGMGNNLADILRSGNNNGR